MLFGIVAMYMFSQTVQYGSSFWLGVWAGDRALIEKALALAPTEGQTPAV